MYDLHFVKLELNMLFDPEYTLVVVMIFDTFHLSDLNLLKAYLLNN